MSNLEAVQSESQERDVFQDNDFSVRIQDELQEIATLEYELKTLIREIGKKSVLKKRSHQVIENVVNVVRVETGRVHFSDDIGKKQIRIDEIENVLLPNLRDRLSYMKGLQEQGRQKESE